MNQWQLNGQLLGSGVTDPRIFLSMNIPVSVDVSTTGYAIRYLTVSIGVKTSHNLVLNGVFQLASALRTKVSLVVDTSKYYAKYLSSSLPVRVVSSAAALAFRNLSAGIPVKISPSFTTYRALPMAASLSVKTAVTSDTNNDFSAPDERVMKLTQENRTTQVT